MSVRPVHDRATLVSYAQITTWAWFLYAFGATLALLRDEQGTSRTISSLHSTLLAIGGLIGALLVPVLVRRWGRGRVLRAGALIAVGGLVAYAWPHAPVATTMLGVFIGGLAAGGLVLVSANAFIMDHQGPAGSSALTEANASASFAGLIGPIVVGIGTATFLTWRIAVILAIASFLLIEVWRGRSVGSFSIRSAVAAKNDRRPLPPRVYWAVGAVMCFVALEFCMAMWSADLLRVRCGFTPAAAAASLALLTGGMFIGRLSASQLARRLNTEIMLRTSIVIALAGFFFAWMFTTSAIVLAGLFVVGLGISVHFPLGLARGLRAAKGLTDRASALISAGASVGIAVAPFALGAMSDTIGFHSAFLLVPALLVISLAIVLFRPIPDEVNAPRVVMTLE